MLVYSIVTLYSRSNSENTIPEKTMKRLTGPFLLPPSTIAASSCLGAQLVATLELLLGDIHVLVSVQPVKGLGQLRARECGCVLLS